MMYRQLFVAVAMVVCAAPVGAQTSVPLTGDNTKIEFLGTKSDGKHTGGFKKLTGTAKLGADPTALKLDLEIDMDSLFTDNTQLTGHLKSADFFEVRTYPKAKFALSKVEKDKDEFKLKGTLTMHGKAKEITCPAKITQTADGLKLDAKFKINRNDWGISYGKGKVDDDVSLTVKLDAKSK